MSSSLFCSRVFQRLIDEQQGQLSQYESAAGQCVGELQKALDQVRSLQAKIRESETRNQVQTNPPSAHLQTDIIHLSLLLHSVCVCVCVCV